MDRQSRREPMITTDELKIFLSEIFKECGDNMEDRKYVKKVLEEVEHIQWCREVVSTYGSEVRDLSELLRDYYEGEFRDASNNDIAFGLSLLIYYTEPRHVSKLARYAMGSGTQMTVTRILLGRCEEMLVNYRLGLYKSNKFLKGLMTKEVLPRTKESNLDFPTNDEMTSAIEDMASWSKIKRSGELGEDDIKDIVKREEVRVNEDTERTYGEDWNTGRMRHNLTEYEDEMNYEENEEDVENNEVDLANYL